MKDFDNPIYRSTPIDPDLDRLLHPARAFEHPRDVANDPDLTLEEKRAILASWASDACVVEAAPALRRPPGSSRAITIDEILEALCSLDSGAGKAGVSRRQAQRPGPEARRPSPTPALSI
jgi:hypothetical protein